ncbi:uncharacterized protein JCM15063_004525 [Sporobolomyces koalae]|uniref:uncharacterized protein n=1 Tax=Sporobolomyces koalae TaxID=500713 RepID=UPI003178140F
MFGSSSRIDPSSSSRYGRLSGLSLHRPHVGTRSIYSSILGSPAWLESAYTELQELGDDDVSERYPNGAHRVIPGAYGSTGCVNAMDWEEGGRERLATAGDDTKICIWSPGHVPPRSGSNKAYRPQLNYGLTETIDTGHRANIFSVKWAPHDETRLFSAGADCTARVYDLSLVSNPSLSTTPTSADLCRRRFSRPALPWSHHSDSACTSVIRCHTDRVKRISTEPYSPSTFLTCSEDGTVRQHDLRQPHACRPAARIPHRIFDRDNSTRGRGCPEPLADYGDMKLYSLSLSKLESHLFAVAGQSPFAYLHDRRMLRGPMIRDWSIEPSRHNLTECVRRFGVPNPMGVERGYISESIVAVKMSPTRSNDLIVSYSERGIYRFDILGDSYESIQRHDLGHEDEQIEAEDDQGDSERVERSKKSKLELPQERSRKRFVPEPLGLDPTPTRVLRQDSPRSEPAISTTVQQATAGTSSLSDDELGIDSEENDESGGREPSVTFSPYEASSRPSPEPDPEVPIVGPIMHYDGHANSQTLKDVNFAFEGQVVVSGSDDGNFFCWDRDSGECVAVFQADSSVVNVVQPHPRLPILAVSGIDSTVKLFGPTNPAADRKEYGNLVDEFETIKSRNMSRHGSNPNLGFSASTMPDALLRLLAARMAQLDRNGDGDGQDESGGPDLGTRGIRVVFGDPDETGETRAADCTIM